MSTRRSTLAGMIGAVSLLALTAAGAQAQTTNMTYCRSGTVVKTGAGYAYPYEGKTPNPTIAANQRAVYLTCDPDALVRHSKDTSPSATGWDGSVPRAFLIPATPDKDGIYAAALTALVDGKKVEYYISSAAESVRVGSTAYRKSWIRLLNIKSEPVSDG